MYSKLKKNKKDEAREPKEANAMRPTFKNILLN